MVTVERPLTLGMRVDAVLSRLDSLSSTELYLTIVGVTVIVSFVLLGHAAPLAVDQELQHGRQQRQQQQQQQQHQQQASSSSSSSSLRKPSGPEPRWHIFRWVNYAMAGAFLWSVWSAYCYMTTDNNNTARLLQFLTAWSVFLCYFFAFFGVSFVHDSVQEEEEGTEESREDAADDKKCKPEKESPPVGAQMTRKNQLELKEPPPAAATLRRTVGPPEQRSAIHPPATSAPVCSDAPSSAASSLLSTAQPVKNVNFEELTDAEVAELVLSNSMKDHQLEKVLNAHRAVAVRRLVVDRKLATLGRAGALDKLPWQSETCAATNGSGAVVSGLDYSRVHGANCEIVVGYLPLPVGLIGPLTLNDETFYVPMATTEGCLVASTNRGAKAITEGGGAHAVILKDCITRAPCVRMQSARQAASVQLWCQEEENFLLLKAAFESTTSFGKLLSCQPTVAGRNVYLRLSCASGDAMGMNMVSKGSLAVIETLQERFPDLTLVALSGNMCTDKKAAATNWIHGRGKSVVVEATIPARVVRTTLKTTVRAMVDCNLHKNLIGSAMAGALGGFNAHASNVVTAVFLATGQDPAQNVESSQCITLLEETGEGDLWISCTMPSLEVGTVGGGTSLDAQAACLEAVGCRGGTPSAEGEPGDNARRLACVVAAAVLAGELSLLAALAANTLVQAHMVHNRKKVKAP